MIRGTTAQFKFKLPCLKRDLDFATIKFWQSNNPNERLPIIKTLSNCGGTDSLPELRVSLSPEETARFSDKYKAKIQFRAAYNGHVFGNKKIMLLTVYPMSDDLIEIGPALPTENQLVVFDGQEIGDQLAANAVMIVLDGQDIGAQLAEDDPWIVIDGQEIGPQGGGVNG